MKEKKCSECKQPFKPTRQLQPTCNKYDCLVSYAEKHLSKKKKEKETKARKALKQFNDSDINLVKRLAQKVFNTYIRMRDGKICISCGFVGDGRQFHAGHFKPRGGNAYLAFNELNVHSQCSICNNHLSGNLVPYRANLIIKIGLEEVEKLESSNIIIKHDVEYYQEIIKKYRLKIKNML